MKRKFIYLFFTYLVLCCMAFFPNANASNSTNRNTAIVNDTLTGLIRQGQNFAENEKYKKAIDVYNQALRIASRLKLSNDASFIYKKIGGIYFSQKQYEKSKSCYRRSISSDSLSKNAADSHFNLALIYRKHKQIDSLLYYLNQSLGLYEKLKDSEDKFRTYLKAGILLKNNGNYDLAISYLLKAYKGFDSFGDQSKKASVCNTIAATQRLLNNLEIGKQYYKEGLNIRETLGDSTRLANGYNNLANLYKSLKKYDSASVYYSKAIRIQHQLQLTKDLGKYHYNLGSVYYINKNFNQANNHYRISLEYKKKEGDSISFTNSYKEIAMIAIERKQFHIAKKYLDSAGMFLNPNQNKDVLLRFYTIKSDYFEAIGDFENSLDYKKRYSQLYENLFKERQVKEIQKLQEQFESKQKLQEIVELTKGNNSQKTIISAQQQSIEIKNLLLLISLILVLLAIAIFFLLRQKQKTKVKSLEVHRLESIFKGQETIKEKISNDLHDIVTTSFDGIRLKILALSKAKNPDAISDTIVKDIADINNQIRLISHRLSPLGNKIKDTLLSDIIITQLSEFQYYRKVFVNLQLPLPVEINNFTLESQTNLYGILLETLNNIDKHSEATEVTIKHYKEKDFIKLIISDNGIGFQNKGKNGIGLISMRQRAQLLNGDCTIKSLDSGTTIILHIPIKLNTK